MCFNIILNIFKAIDESTTNNCNDNKSGMRSVLVYVRNKSSKKSVSWKQENDLVKVSYFEHDETERGIAYILILMSSCTHTMFRLVITYYLLVFS